MKYLIVAGGTGGHIYPAISIINKIKEEDKNNDILYIGNIDRMEKNIIPKMNIKFIGLKMEGINRKNIFKNIKVYSYYKKAYKESLKIIDEFRPDIAIGVGGYITVPVLKACKKRKIKILIHEQNSIPGISNRMLSKIANVICISLPNSKKYFKTKAKVVLTGNPRGEEIVKVDKLDKKLLGFDNNKKLVVIVMGSLGSLTMTKKLIDSIESFRNKYYEVLIITGNNYYKMYKNIKLPDNVKIEPFMNNLINLLKTTDILVSRAGASTISEITALGLVSILVPSPYVTANHQEKNALELEEKNACRVILEKDFTKDKLINEIDKLFDNKKEFDIIKKNSKELGISNSKTLIYNEIKNILLE